MKHHDHERHHHYHSHLHHSHPGTSNRHAPKFALAGLLVATAAGLGLLAHKKTAKRKEASVGTGFQLTSPAFESGERIPVRYTCKGVNVSPPLELSGVPATAQSVAIVLRDPDAPSGDYLHWVMWDIHPGITTILEDTVPVGASEGLNDFGEEGYGGPCPPMGNHHYEFTAYALDASLDLPAGSEKTKVMTAIKKHTIATTKLIGSFSAGS